MTENKYVRLYVCLCVTLGSGLGCDVTNGRRSDPRTKDGDVASHPKYMNFNSTSFEACYFLQSKIYG